MVLRYKKLFQTSAATVQMAASQTNCHAFTVWAHQVKFIIASNKWELERQTLCGADASWLHEDSVYIPVT